jgi:hypothetical protein
MQKLLIAMLLLVATAHGQASLDFQFLNKGFGLTSGYRDNVTLITVNGGYQIPFEKTENPFIVHISGGKGFVLSKRDDSEKYWCITPIIGVAYTYKKDFAKYDRYETDTPETIEKTRVIVSTEFAKNWYHSQLHLTVSYCSIWFAGIGWRVFYRR